MSTVKIKMTLKFLKLWLIVMEIMHMPADSAWDLGTVLLFIERELQ